MPGISKGLTIILYFSILLTALLVPVNAHAKLNTEELGNTVKDQIAQYAKNIKDNPTDGDIAFSDSRKLVEIHHVKAFEALKELYSTGTETVKAKIIKAIGVQRDKAIDAAGSYWEIFGQALGSGSKELSDAAVESLAWLESEEYFNRIVEKLKTKDTPKTEVDNAVRVLCCFRKSPTNEMNLTAKTIGLRVEAARALTARSDAACLKSLMNAIEKKLAITFADLAGLEKWWESNKEKSIAQILEEANLRLQAEMDKIREESEKNRQKAVREKILYLEQLLANEEKKAIALFLKELSDPESEPEVLVFVIGKLGLHKTKDAFDEILKKLQSKNTEVRIAALRALGLLANENALDEVAKRISAGSHQEKLAAIETIAKLKGEKAAQLLLEDLKDEKDISVIRAVVKALGDIKQPVAIVPLVQMAGEVVDEKLARLRKTVNNDFLKWIADALGSILSNNSKAVPEQRELAIDYLLAMLSIELDEVKWKAVDNLGNVGAVRATGELIKVLNADPNTGVRARAARAIGKMPKTDETAIAAIFTNLVSSKEKEVYDSCVWALRRISGLNGSHNELDLPLLKKLSSDLVSAKKNSFLRMMLAGLPMESELKQASDESKNTLNEIRGLLAEAHVEAGDWQSAVNELEKVVIYFKDDKGNRLKYGEMLAKSYASLEQYATKAMDEYERLIKLAEPQQAKVFWQEYAKLVDKTGDDKEKLRRIESALKLTPPPPPAIKENLERLRQELSAKLPKEPKTP